MKFQHYDLGLLKGNEVVEVTISGNAVNIKLMDFSNFQNYKNNRKHQFYGGHVSKSPFKVSIPASGHWFITIDLGGYSGSFQSSVRIL